MKKYLLLIHSAVIQVSPVSNEIKRTEKVNTTDHFADNLSRS